LLLLLNNIKIYNSDSLPPECLKLDKRRVMKRFVVAATIVFLLLFLTSCTGYTSSTKDTITVKDSLAFHGSCVITGTILDNNTNEPVRGANVVVLSKPIRSVTDLYGQFQFNDILPGTYTLQVFCVGYVEKDFPDIQAKSDRLIKLDLRLAPRPVSNE
jgi:hypothetical protein